MYCFPLKDRKQMYWKKGAGVNILVISVTNLSYYKNYSPLGLYKIHGKACNSAISERQKPSIVF